MDLRLLVVEGNASPEREAQRALLGRTASRSYADTLLEVAPDAICDICLPADEGADLPDSAGLESYDGVFVTGSALNLYDGGPAILRQIELARAVFAARVPFFGSCWGLQVAAAASGGGVRRNPAGREIGLARHIAPTEAGRDHPLLAGRPAAYDALASHIDIVALPPQGAVTLAANANALVQAAEIRYDGGIFWGVQYHPEFSLGEIAAILERRRTSLALEGLFAREEDALAYVAQLRALEADGARRDIASRLGLGADVTDKRLRRTELRNFIDLLVRPEKSRRGRH
jgi:GMP synthase (glutamine-hydrolysing)